MAEANPTKTIITCEWMKNECKKKNRKEYKEDMGQREKFKKPNKCVIRVPEEEEREKGTELKSEEIMVEKFPKLMKDINTQFQQAQQNPGRMNTKKTTARHVMAKLLKTKHKEKTLKASRGKKTSKGITVQMMIDFATKIIEARIQWNNTFFKVLKEDNL